ncbi:MAG: tetratricopeptide repeat protein [Verrucomicrobiia bacterium]|jgi:tetratricopeptide (TPR) repeat protein
MTSGWSLFHETVEISDVDAIEIQKHLEAAEGYAALGMHDDALTEVDALLAQRPDCVDGISAKAFVLLSARRYADAELWLEKLLAVRPKNVDGWIHLAYCRRRTKSLEAAIETLESARRLRDDYPLANYNMACYRAVQGRHEEALRLLDKAIRKDAAYRRLACEEEDFNSMRHLPGFLSLVGQS